MSRLLDPGALAARIFPEVASGRQGPEIGVRCPIHGDQHPSASLNTEKWLFHCHTCGKGATLEQLATELGYITAAPPYSDSNTKLARYVSALHSPFDIPNDMLECASFTRAAAERVGLRFFREERAFVWPVRDASGAIVAVKRRMPTDRVKSRSFGPTSKGLLAEGRFFDGEATMPVLVVSGEKDLTIAVDLLRDAWTGIVVATASGENAWPPTYSEMLRGRDLFVAFDIDDAGKRGALVAAKKLRGIARSISIVTLRDLSGSKQEKDIADLLRKLGCEAARESLLRSIRAAEISDGLTMDSEEEPSHLVERDGRYFEPQGRERELVAISSFVLKVQELIEVPGRGDVFRVALKPRHGAERTVDLSPDAFETSNSFRRAINVVAGATWSGSQRALAHLKEKLARSAAGIRKTGVSQIGRHGDVFVFGRNFAIAANGPQEIPSVALLPTPAAEVVAQRIEAAWGADLEFGSMLGTVVPALIQLQSRSALGVWLGFLHASFLRPLLVAKGALGHFPILSISGEQGSGKTTLLQLLSRLAGFDGREFESRGTAFALAALASSSNALPIVLDEYRPGERARRFEELLRGNYSGQAVVRGRADQGLNVYSNDAPIACGGEVAFEDAALNDRTIGIRLVKAYTAGHPDSRVALRTILNQDLRMYAPRYAAWTLRIAVRSFLESARADVETVLGHSPAEHQRVGDNLVVIALGMRLFEAFVHSCGIEIELGLPWREPIVGALVLVEENQQSVRAGLDRFLNDLNTMARIGVIRHGVEFFVLGHELRIHLAAAFAKWREFLRRQGETDEVLTESEIRRRFRESFGAADSYVLRPTATDAHFGLDEGKQKRRSSYSFDLEKAAALGLDLDALRPTRTQLEPEGRDIADIGHRGE